MVTRRCKRIALTRVLTFMHHGEIYVVFVAMYMRKEPIGIW